MKILKFITYVLRRFHAIVRRYYIANYTDYWVWRVKYPNGERTRRLGYAEAKSLQEVFGGKLFMDEDA